MSKKVLIVDANSVAAENLKARLSAVATVQVAGDAAQLDLALSGSWDAIISDSGLGGADGAAFWAKLQPKRQSVFLYTDKNELVEGSSWKNAGLTGAFSRLQRADLVLAIENALQGPAASGSAPAFLLVEDSATVRQFVKAVLRQGFPGSEVVEAEDGRAALAAMKSSRVSLIITDLQMPGMDGLSFVQLLRNNAVLKKKPVLVLSGAVTDEARENLSHLDKVQVLAKPAAPDALVDAVKKLLA